MGTTLLWPTGFCNESLRMMDGRKNNVTDDDDRSQRRDKICSELTGNDAGVAEQTGEYQKYGNKDKPLAGKGEDKGSDHFSEGLAVNGTHHDDGRKRQTDGLQTEDLYRFTEQGFLLKERRNQQRCPQEEKQCENRRKGEDEPVTEAEQLLHLFLIMGPVEIPDQRCTAKGESRQAEGADHHDFHDNSHGRNPIIPIRKKCIVGQNDTE